MSERDLLTEVLDEMVDDTLAASRRRLTPAIRCATDEDRRAAASHGPIPFHTINPSALVQAEDLYESMTGEVESIAFGAAVSLYLEAMDA